MEVITVEDELRLVEEKRENMRKAMEKVKSELASGLLVCGTQWSELEDTMKSAKRNVEKELREVESKETELEKRSVEIEERAKLVDAAEANMADLETKADWLRTEIGEKQISLAFLEDRVFHFRNDYAIDDMRLKQLKILVERYASEHVTKTGQLRQLEEVLRKTQADLDSRRGEFEDYGKKLESVEAQLESQQRLLETRSTEDKELKELEQAKQDLMLDLDLASAALNSVNYEKESKAKKLEEMKRKIEERNAYYQSIKTLIAEHSEELSSKEKKQAQLTEDLRKLSFEKINEELTLQRCKDFIKKLSEKLSAKEDMMESASEYLRLKKNKFRIVRDRLKIKKKELNQIQSSIAKITSLMEREQEILVKEKKLEEKDQLLKTTEERLAKRFKDYEEKAKQLSPDCNALMDSVGSASLSREEIVFGLRTLTDPGKTVLGYVEQVIRNAVQRRESGLSEPIIKTLIPFLEELMLTQDDTNSINTGLQQDAKILVFQWRSIKGSAHMSPLEAWCFLLLIAAYQLMDLKIEDKDENLIKYASYVAHFNLAPKLFQSLRLSHAVPNLVCKLLNHRQYIPAIRFISFFNLKTNNSPVELLKIEITNLRLSAKETSIFDSQGEERDARKLREIIQVIEDLKLEIDLPVDLIVKFMVPRGIQNYQNEWLALSSSVPVQQDVDVKMYDTGGSTAQSSHQAGLERLRMDPPGPGSAFRSYSNPPSSGSGGS